MGRNFIFIVGFLCAFYTNDLFAVIDCSGYDNPSDCTNFGNCTWRPDYGICIPPCNTIVEGDVSRTCANYAGCSMESTNGILECTWCPPGYFCPGTDDYSQDYEFKIACPAPFDKTLRVYGNGSQYIDYPGSTSVQNCFAKVDCTGAEENYPNIYLKCNNWGTVTIDNDQYYKCVPANDAPSNTEYYTQWSWQSNYLLGPNDPKIIKIRTPWVNNNDWDNENPLTISRLYSTLPPGALDESYHFEVKAKYKESPETINYDHPIGTHTVWEEHYAEEIRCVPNRINCSEFATPTNNCSDFPFNICNSAPGCYLYTNDNGEELCVSDSECHLHTSSGACRSDYGCQWIGQMEGATLNICVSTNTNDIGAGSALTNCANGSIDGMAEWQNTSYHFGFWNVSACECRKNATTGDPQPIDYKNCMGYQPKTYNGDQTELQHNPIRIVRSIWEHIIFSTTASESSNYYCVQCLPDDNTNIYHAQRGIEQYCDYSLDTGHICKCAAKQNGRGYWRTGTCNGRWTSGDDICWLGRPDASGNTDDDTDGICPVGQTTEARGPVLNAGGTEDDVCNYATNTKFTDAAGSFNFSDIDGPDTWNVIWP